MILVVPLYACTLLQVGDLLALLGISSSQAIGSTDTSGNQSHHVSMCRGLQNSHSGNKCRSPYSVSIPNLGVSQLNVSQVEVPLQGSDSGCTLVRLDPCEEFFPGFLACTLQVSLRLIVSTGTRSKPQSITDIRC